MIAMVLSFVIIRNIEEKNLKKLPVLFDFLFVLLYLFLNSQYTH